MFSKNVKQCERYVPLSLRHQNSSSSKSLEPTKMQSKAMALTQWKVLNQLKDYFSKLSNEKTIQNTINKEFAQFLQKIQPSVYGSDLVRNFDSTIADPKQNVGDKTENKAEPSGYSIPNMITGLKYKMNPKDAGEPKDVTPKWKVASSAIVSKECVLSRTRHVISAIMSAEGETSRFKRIEDLSAHLKQYPVAKNHAVKEGAIRLLLRIRERSTEPSTLAAIREAFALLGYCDSLPGQGVRILSIDGGGIRGLLVVEMLRKLEELTGKRVHEMFDFICGVSTGAIISASVGIHQSELDLIAYQYKEISTKVFTQSALWGTSNLVWSHSYYDTALWEQSLKEYLGEEPLISTSRNPNCPKWAAVSAVVNQSRVSAYVFRNYTLPWRIQSQYMGGHDHKVWEAVRASAAAPTYFEECRLGSLLHQDGGILVNNPTAVAIHEAKQLWPDTPIQCVVSFGTGRTVPGHPEDITETTSNSSSWKNKFMKILDSATDTEGVHTMLNDLLPGNVYYRFNPYLTEMLGMAEIDPKKLEQLERDAVMYLRRNEDKFQEAAKVLCETKGATRKALDWITLKSEIVGINTK